jgi:hypothetical protein
MLVSRFAVSAKTILKTDHPLIDSGCLKDGANNPNNCNHSQAIQSSELFASPSREEASQKASRVVFHQLIETS